jgi:hypothetical protein
MNAVTIIANAHTATNRGLLVDRLQPALVLVG